MDAINFEYFVSLKGEFEAEGLSRDVLASESLYAARKGLDYLVKIGGCEAKGDVNFLVQLGVTSVVAPMIETPFAMEKYMEILPEGHFEHVGVTIETITAVTNIAEILKVGNKLTEVTIGRTDLTASYRGEGVDSSETMAMVKSVATLAKDHGFKVTMGGSINKITQQLLIENNEIYNLLDYVETRKVVMPVVSFIQKEALTNALKLEAFLLERRAVTCETELKSLNARRNSITTRI
jgi:hypothetical protein